MKIQKLLENYKDYLIVIIGSNFTGFLNLILALVILRLATKEDYNLYTAFSSLLLIFSAPNKIIKSLATAYGSDLLKFFKIDKINNFKKVFIYLIGSSLFTLIIYQIVGKDFSSSFYLGFSIIIQLVFFTLIGILQNSQKFLYSSTLLFFQNLGKLIIGLILYKWMGNTSIWLALLISTLVPIFFIKTTDSKGSTSIKISISDLILDILLIVSLEIFFNIDSLLVIKNLPTDDAYVYNALILLKKSIFFSVFGISQIILSQAKKVIRKNESLVKNLSINLIVGCGLGMFFWVFKGVILNILHLNSIETDHYLQFILSTIIFSVLYMLTISFTTIKEIKIKFIPIILLFLASVTYSFFANSIDELLNFFIIGNLLIILVELLVIKMFWKAVT